MNENRTKRNRLLADRVISGITVPQYGRVFTRRRRRER